MPAFRLRRFLRSLCLLSLLPLPLRAQGVVTFSTSDAGVVKRIPHWGLDTNWASSSNMRRGLSFMGTENVDTIRLPGMVDAPTDAGLTSAQKAHMDECMAIAGMATAATRWDLCAPGSDTVHSWYQSGVGSVYVDRWVRALKLAQEYYNRKFWLVEPFNEPDYAAWGEGTKQNLYDIMGGLQALPNFTGSLLGGGSTMSVDQAAPWHDAMAGRAGAGTTHCLYGTVANYVAFIQNVNAAGRTSVNPEGHNLVEAILGAEYGLDTFIWWASAERARGEFLRASLGTRLGYGENRSAWTAAAVYRSPAGRVQAFLGSSERVGASSTYTLRCTDRDVYFDGHGPQREYTVTIAKNQERVINITWGPDVEKVVNGRYALVNVNSGLCLDFAGTSGLAGTPLVQKAFTRASSQLWDVAPVPSRAIGDVSYLTFANVAAKQYADLADWPFQDGAPVKLYNYPANEVEQWFLEYAGDGCYYIRSKWSNKCLSIAGAARAAEAAVVQSAFNGSSEQKWRFEDPAGLAVAAPLRLTTQPAPVVSASGQTMTFAASATGTGRVTYQWYREGVALPGATDAHLVVKKVTAAEAGSYTVRATDSAGTVTSAAAALVYSDSQDSGRLINLSLRSPAGTGERTLIGGFVVGGPAGSQRVLIRGIGPSLGAFGITSPLARSELTLYNPAGVVQSGQAWGGSPPLAQAFASAGAFALSADSLDAALLPVLPSGAYTAHLTGVGGTTGVALIELYDGSDRTQFDERTSPRLTNVSARSQVGAGQDVLICGFAVGGSTSRTVLIRAVGPGLAQFGLNGLLAAPRLELIHDGTVLASNDGWAGDAQVAAIGQEVGAFPLPDRTSHDAVLLVTLPPGTYSAKVSGADGGTGVAIAEIYDVP